MSPIFPYITNVKEIIDVSKEYIYEYWFENLNLRGSYKQTILNYIKSNYPELVNYYDEIYNKKNKQYWIELSKDIEKYCDENKIKYINYFYHEELVKNKE